MLLSRFWLATKALVTEKEVQLLKGTRLAGTAQAHRASSRRGTPTAQYRLTLLES